jgi:hypothetical protein
VVESCWYQELFPDMVIDRRRTRDIEIVTTSHGYRYATSMGGSVLGRGADIILIDDPIKAVDALSEAERQRVNAAFDNTIATRLNHKTEGAIVMIMQRLHEDDLVGHVTRKGAWELVTIPAIATEDEEYRLGEGEAEVYWRPAGGAAECVWKDERRAPKACAYTVRVRIRVRAGETIISRDGSGVGQGIGETMGEAHESALKEAETDATKRALTTFGNLFGLALYDKTKPGCGAPPNASRLIPRESSYPCSMLEGRWNTDTRYRKATVPGSAMRSRRRHLRKSSNSG